MFKGGLNPGGLKGVKIRPRVLQGEMERSFIYDIMEGAVTSSFFLPFCKKRCFVRPTACFQAENKNILRAFLNILEEISKSSFATSLRADVQNFVF